MEKINNKFDSNYKTSITIIIVLSMVKRVFRQLERELYGEYE